MNLSPPATTRLLDVARVAICAKLAGRVSDPPRVEDLIDAAELALELAQLAGCFVSLHETDTRRLRGCVGRLDATHPVIVAVHQSAENVLEDPRFLRDAIRADELADLELEVSVLSPLQPVPSPLAFEPLEHGIYLQLGVRTGCFLPQVARETGWTRRQLLDRLCVEKLGVAGSAWQGADAKLFVFTALVLGPVPCVLARSLHVSG